MRPPTACPACSSGTSRNRRPRDLSLSGLRPTRSGFSFKQMCPGPRQRRAVCSRGHRCGQRLAGARRVPRPSLPGPSDKPKPHDAAAPAARRPAATLVPGRRCSASLQQAHAASRPAPARGDVDRADRATTWTGPVARRGADGGIDRGDGRVRRGCRAGRINGAARQPLRRPHPPRRAATAARDPWPGALPARGGKGHRDQQRTGEAAGAAVRTTAGIAAALAEHPGAGRSARAGCCRESG
jgi:hypothetical protein